MPRTFSDQEKETIHQLLLEKGMVLFEKYGIKKTTVEDLARAAGISKGAFYLFFPSKEELLMQILEYFEKDIHTRILNLTIEPESDSKDKIAALLKDTLLTWTRYPLLNHLGKADFEYLIRKLPPERIQQHTDQDRDFVNLFLQKIQKEGVAISVDPRIVSGLFKSLFFISLHKDDLGDASYDEIIQVLTTLVAGYICEGK